MKTYVIHGLLTRPPGARKSKEQYAYTDLVYNVEDGISFDDIERVLHQSNIRRSVPYDIREQKKLDFVIGMDRERSGSGGPILNRVGFSKKALKDINNLEWVQPQ